MPSPSASLLAALALAAWSACAQPRWTLAWSDEFEGPPHTAPDPSKWDYDLGGGGWGNRELQVYTKDTANASLDGEGRLAIRANPAGAGYTSARLVTRGRFEFQYGKVEARIQTPRATQGLWPAFWMLGANLPKSGWPECGEIDILENIGKEPSILHAAIHGPGHSGGRGITAQTTLADNAPLSDAFHVYSVEWTPGRIEFSLDGRAYSTLTPASLPKGARWVYDHPFYLLLNVAVGGQWPGNPDSTSVFPQTMLVDWVRVYRDRP